MPRPVTVGASEMISLRVTAQEKALLLKLGYGKLSDGFRLVMQAYQKEQRTG